MEKRKIKRPEKTPWLYALAVLLLCFTFSPSLALPVFAAEVAITSTDGGELVELCPGKKCCEVWLDVGQPFTVKAKPEKGHYFGGWSGVCKHRKNVCTFVVPDTDEPLILRARFYKRKTTK